MYDNAARLDTAEQSGAASSLTGVSDYDYDPAQNLIRRQRTSACGDITVELPRDASGRNRPGSVAGDSLQWDDRGRLAQKRDLLFEYDDRDRLVAVRRKIGAESTEPVASYTYDIQNRRVAREVGGTQIRTAWDGWQAIEDYVGPTIVSQRFFGFGLDQMFLMQLPQGSGELAPYFPVYDGLGNLSVLVRADGTPVERYEYDPYGGRTIVANDFHPPILEQIRLQDGEIRLQLSEPTVKNFQSSVVVLQNLSRAEQPEIAVEILGTEGRQWGRQIAFRDGSDPADDPPTWPQAGDHVKLVIAEHAFVDNFGNRSETSSYADLIWPGANGILVDTTPPRIEEICSQGSELKLTFSEPVSAELAAQALTIDSQPVAWVAENDGYTLKFNLEAGSHDLVLDQKSLDLAGLALAEYDNLIFVTDTTTKPIYAATFPGEAAASTVGNVYGFQGLPEDAETGFLYVRHRYYDPELGRFITTDPMGYRDGPSQYQFALNNPVVNSDPTGEFVPCLIAGGMSVAFGWGINKALNEDYDAYDAVTDFAVGSLTCGAGTMVSVAAKAGKIGKAGQAFYTIGADIALNVGGEAARSFAHGEEITAGGLARSASLTLLAGHGVPVLLRKASARREAVEKTVKLFRYANKNDPSTLLPPGSKLPEGTMAGKRVKSFMNKAIAHLSKNQAEKMADLHMSGETNWYPYSPFVSLGENLSDLSNSLEPWLASIVRGPNKAPHIGIFEVPVSRIVRPLRSNSLSASESEVVFLGTDLHRYLVKWEPNYDWEQEGW